MPDIKVECKVEFNKEDKTATLIQKKDGIVTKLTIFADSDKTNAKNPQNSIFDANDRFEITNGEGQKLKNPKLNAGAVARFLTAINQKNPKDGIGLKKVQASGEMFTPGSFESDGCEYDIVNAGTLCEIAKKHNVPPKGSSTNVSAGTQGMSTNTKWNGGLTVKGQDNRAIIAELYYEIIRKESILSSLAANSQNLGFAMQSVANSNPYSLFAARTFLANGLPIAAGLQMGYINPQMAQAFQAAAGISVQEAVSEVRALKERLAAELNKSGMTIEQALGSNAAPGTFAMGVNSHSTAEDKIEEIAEAEEIKETSETEQELDETEVAEDEPEVEKEKDSGNKPIGNQDLEKFYEDLKRDLGLSTADEAEMKQFDEKVRKAILQGNVENKEEVKKLITDLIKLKEDYNKNADDIEKQEQINQQIKAKTEKFNSIINSPENKDAATDKAINKAKIEKKKTANQNACLEIIYRMNKNFAKYTPKKINEYKNMLTNVLDNDSLTPEEMANRLERLAKMGEQILVGYEKAIEIDTNGHEMSGWFEPNSKYIKSGEAIEKVDINKDNVLETIHAYHDMLGVIRGKRNLINFAEGSGAIKKISDALIERLLSNPQLTDAQKQEVQQMQNELFPELLDKNATAKAKDITNKLLTMTREIEYKDFK